MNKKTSTVIVIVVLILIVLFGVGMFFASPSQISEQSATSTSTQTAPAQATQVIAFMPTAQASSTPQEKGSCWTNSIAAPSRADAWRCSVGNSIQDPCFQIAGSTSTLLCGMNPAEPEATSSFILDLTKPLPQANISPANGTSNSPWLIQLSDGTLCSPFTGTLPPVTLNGATADYSCAPGPLGNNLVIFTLNNSQSQWTALLGDIAQSTSTAGGPPVYVDASATVPVASVWE